MNDEILNAQIEARKERASEIVQSMDNYQKNALGYGPLSDDFLIKQIASGKVPQNRKRN